MKKREWAKRLMPAALLAVLLLCFPKTMTDGIRSGLLLCGTAVIPSLFPFLVLCTFFVRSGLCASFGRAVDALARRVFRLPGAAAGAVLLGLCGGFPVGTRMAAALYDDGSVTALQAKKLCLFCVAAGPAFVTGAVGAGMLHSRVCGRILFLCVTAANLTVGVLLRFIGTAQAPTHTRAVYRSIPQSICDAVSDAGTGMLPLCAWILLFSGVCACLQTLPQHLYVPLCCVLEVTNGCRVAIENGLSLPILAAILGFGGLSVHCQVLPYVTRCGVKLSHFLVSRVVSGALAAVYCAEYLRFFPQAAQTLLLQNGQVMEFSQASVPVSAALLCTAAVFIVNTARLREEHEGQ